MSDLFYVGLDSADMLVTGIDAFIIRRSELPGKISSFKNCYSRIKGTDRETSVLENIRKLEVCSDMGNFVNEDIRNAIITLSDMIKIERVVRSLNRSSDGRNFSTLVNEVKYIVTNDVIYTKLVMMKFKSLYHAVGRLSTDTSNGYEFMDYLKYMRNIIYSFMLALEDIENEVNQKVTGVCMGEHTSLLALSLMPNAENLEDILEVLADDMDTCMRGYYAEQVTVDYVRDKLKALANEFTTLRALVPLGVSCSGVLMNNIERRLNLCTVSYQNVGIIDNARNLFAEVAQEYSRYKEEQKDEYINAIAAVEFGGYTYESEESNSEDFLEEVVLEEVEDEPIQIVVFKPL